MNIVKAAYPPPDVYFKRKVALISGASRLLDCCYLCRVASRCLLAC